MTGMWKGRRGLSLLLVLALCLSLMPPYALPVYSEESDPADPPLIATDPGDYSALIGCNAELNFDFWLNIVISDDPTVAVEDGQDLCATDVAQPVTLVIEACHWVAETNALWLKVDAADGATLPEKLQQYPWVFQNYTDVYDEEDWESFSPDALRLFAPEYKEPVNIVSDDGVTVSLEQALFTDLTVTQTQAPQTYYINRAIAYQMTPRTNDGKYTGHADVSIPIPEGWDSEKVFGFVVEEDDTVTAIPGTVTQFGTFQFTVPHFSEVGLLEATAVEDVRNITIVFGKIQTDKVMDIDGTYGETGRHVSDDGCVEYVINHVTLNGQAKTYVSFTGLDVTAGTQIILGNGASEISIVVIVEALRSEVDKLLTGGDVASSEALDPLYDLGISGDFAAAYTLAEGESNVTLSGNTITAVPNSTGNAIVYAEVKHSTSGNTVGHVTYRVTVTDADVTSVKNIHVPAKGTATITGLSGALNSTMLDTAIANATLSGSNLTITSNADEGITYVVVGKTLLVIHTNPNADNNTTKYVSIKIETLEHCTVYYAINGGPLYQVAGESLIVSQNYADGFNIMFFSVPEEGYATSLISQSIDAGQSSFNQYYSLVNGSRYDGSDSAAWPLDDENATTSPTGSGDNAWKTDHGLRWCLLEGNMDVSQLRDLFTRALALGSDCVTTFTKNNTSDAFRVTEMTFIAEKLPTFSKEILKVERNGETIFDEGNPYNPATSDPLKIGDVITYQFTVTFHSKYMGFDTIKVEDSKIGLTEDMLFFTTVAVPNNTATATVPAAQSRTCKYTLVESDISQYANGQFTNQATLSYAYSSAASKGSIESVTSASVLCRISSIVTWVDNYGTVWSVQNVTQGDSLPTVVDPTKTGYRFDGWDYGTAVNDGNIKLNGDAYTVTFESNSSFTIYGNFMPQAYSMNFALDGGKLPGETQNPTIYTIEDLLTLPVPSKEGHTFSGWLVTQASAAEGNWTVGSNYAGGTVLLRRYGDVTLTAQWTVNQYTITFDSDGGSAVAPITQNYGTGIIAPQAPTKDACVFLGWEPALPATMPAQDLTLKAVWGPATTTLTIQVTDCQSADENQTFLFRITDQNGLNLTVTVHGNSSVTVAGLTLGEVYTVTEISDWSWRYSVTAWDYEGVSGVGKEAMVTVLQDGSITYSHTRDQWQWLDGNAWLEDLLE